MSTKNVPIRSCHSLASQNTMNTFSKISVLLALIHYINKTSASIEVAIQNKSTAPLAVYQESNGELVVAKPNHSLKEQNKITIVYDVTDIEYFALACPAHTNSQLQQQNQWNGGKSKTTVLFPGDRTDCERKMIPTILRHDNSGRCHENNDKRKGDIYGVGYWVWNENNQIVEFVTIYKFCYTEEDGTLYTVHTIQSPDLLEFKNYYQTDIVYQSVFDTNVAYNRSKTWWEGHDEKDFKKYQLVNYYDMAAHSWKIATFFSFNYIALKNYQMKKYFNTIDNYIRYFAKKKSIELTVYSGTYSKANTQISYYLFISREYVTSTDHFVWKLVHDHEYRAIIIVTHLPPYEYCNRICTYVPVTFDESEHGCTYTCQLDKTLLSNLGLQNFKWTEFLIFDLPAIEQPKEKNLNDDSRNPVKKPIEVINISSFLKTYLNFQSAVSAYEDGKPIEDSIHDSIYKK